MKKSLFLLAFLVGALGANELIVAAGAGYKKPVSVVIENLQKDGKNVVGSYANLAQVIAQAKAGKTSIVIGDEAFLNKSDLGKGEYLRLGRGELVLVTAKDVKISDISELKKLSKIAMPDGKKAIYGVRTLQALEKANLSEALKDKLLAVSTVPQVSAYVQNGEVEAGFINSTEVIGKENEFGSVIRIDESLYEPVFISATRLSECDTNNACLDAWEELKSERSKEIFANFGLK